jgi:hypothetical protein
MALESCRRCDVVISEESWGKIAEPRILDYRSLSAKWLREVIFRRLVCRTRERSLNSAPAPESKPPAERFQALGTRCTCPRFECTVTVRSSETERINSAALGPCAEGLDAGHFLVDTSVVSIQQRSTGQLVSWPDVELRSAALWPIYQLASRPVGLPGSPGSFGGGRLSYLVAS